MELLSTIAKKLTEVVLKARIKPMPYASGDEPFSYYASLTTTTRDSPARTKVGRK
jgi:hypothetical protein